MNLTKKINKVVLDLLPLIIGAELWLFYDGNKESYLQTKEQLILGDRLGISEDEVREVIENRDLFKNVFFGTSELEYRLSRIKSFFSLPGRYTAYLLHDNN